MRTEGAGLGPPGQSGQGGAAWAGAGRWLRQALRPRSCWCQGGAWTHARGRMVGALGAEQGVLGKGFLTSMSCLKEVHVICGGGQAAPASASGSCSSGGSGMLSPGRAPAGFQEEVRSRVSPTERCPVLPGDAFSGGVGAASTLKLGGMGSTRTAWVPCWELVSSPERGGRAGVQPGCCGAICAPPPTGKMELGCGLWGWFLGIWRRNGILRWRCLAPRPPQDTSPHLCHSIADFSRASSPERHSLSCCWRGAVPSRGVLWVVSPPYSSPPHPPVLNAGP